MTYYDLLQVSSSASKEVIQAAWKALMRSHHPDGSKPDEEIARLLNEAHETLCDPKKRRVYDRMLKAKQPQPIPVTQGPVNPNAYPPAYPFRFPGLTLNLGQLIEHAIRSGSQAALDKIIEDNPTLASMLNTSQRKRR